MTILLFKLPRIKLAKNHTYHIKKKKKAVFITFSNSQYRQVKFSLESDFKTITLLIVGNTMEKDVNVKS